MKIKLLSLVLTLMVGLLACGNREEKARSLYNDALTAERKGNVLEYEHLLKKIVEEYGTTDVATEANKELAVIEREQQTLQMLRWSAAGVLGTLSTAQATYSATGGGGKYAWDLADLVKADLIDPGLYGRRMSTRLRHQAREFTDFYCRTRVVC